MKPSLTQEELKKVLHYDPETGIFRWRYSPRIGMKDWDVAGASHNGGYRQLRVGKANYLEHRLAWLYITGEWPKDQIDHINGVKTDNRFENLRDVSNLLNSQNQRNARLSSKSGLIGASWDNTRNKWVSQITVKGKHMYLGRYDTSEEAHSRYLEAKRELHEGNTL